MIDKIVKQKTDAYNQALTDYWQHRTTERELMMKLENQPYCKRKAAIQQLKLKYIFKMVEQSNPRASQDFEDVIEDQN